MNLDRVTYITLPQPLSLMQQGKGRKTRDEKLESTFKVGSN